jgi:hypothetical protein
VSGFASPSEAGVSVKLHHEGTKNTKDTKKTPHHYEVPATRDKKNKEVMKRKTKVIIPHVAVLCDLRVLRAFVVKKQRSTC